VNELIVEIGNLDIYMQTQATGAIIEVSVVLL